MKGYSPVRLALHGPWTLDLGPWTLDFGLLSESFHQMLLQIRDFNAFLFPGIAVAHCYRLVLQRLMVHRHTERRSNLILSRIELADATRIVIDSTQRRLQRLLDRLRQANNL